MSDNKIFNTLEIEKRYFVRFFRLSTIGIIVTLTLFIMIYISYDRWHFFNSETEAIKQQYMQTEREAIKQRILQIEQFINFQIGTLDLEAKKMLSQSVIQMSDNLTFSYLKQSTFKSPEAYIEHIRDNLRKSLNLGITDIDNDNHLFIIDNDGTSLLENNHPSLEGTNLLDHPQYGPMIKEYLEQIDKKPSGNFVNGYIGPLDQPVAEAHTFIVKNDTLNVIVGAHVDRHDILHMIKHNLIQGMRNIFSFYDEDLIAADLYTMDILIHGDPKAEGKNITAFPELMESFKSVMQGLQRGENYGKIICIKDYNTHELDEKTIYVKKFDNIGLILSTGFFESDHDALIAKKISALKKEMFEEMLTALFFILFFASGAIVTSLLFKRKIFSTFDFFGDKIQGYQMELTKSLTIDPLTRLHNRSSLIHDIEKHPEISLAIINIDDFHEINDSYGTDFGDKVIQHLADQINGAFSSKHYTIYRLHADEFALMKPSVDKNDPHAFFRMTRGFIETLRTKVETIEGISINMHVTAGVAYGDKALLHADLARKIARKGQEHCVLYEESFDTTERYRKNIRWANKAKWAIDNDRVVPYFQPIYNIRNMTIAKFECLVRIIDEDGTIVGPNQFLQITKRSHLYHEITRIMIRKSIEHFAGTPHAFSINLSISDINNAETVHLLHMLIDEYGVHGQLILEIVETEELENNETVSHFFEQMRAMGCKVAIDDFGTGYSNFSYLQSIKPDFIKIDGSLIKHIDDDINAKHIVEVIVQYAKRHGIETIAEFVSSQKLLWQVTALGVDYAQGYYIEKPQPDTNGLSCLLIKEETKRTPVTSPTGL